MATSIVCPYCEAVVSPNDTICIYGGHKVIICWQCHKTIEFNNVDFKEGGLRWRL